MVTATSLTVALGLLVLSGLDVSDGTRGLLALPLLLVGAAGAGYAIWTLMRTLLGRKIR